MWLGKSAVWPVNSTRDDGATFRIENQLNMQAYYFFMSNQRVKHSRSVYTLLKVMSDFGGMIEIFTMLFAWSCTAFNDRQFLAKMIRALYFKDNSEPGTDSNIIKIKPLKFTLREKFHDLFLLEWLRCCRKREKDDGEKIFMVGCEQIKEDFNLFRLIQTVNKLKAAIHVVLQHNIGCNEEDILKEIQCEYVKASILHPGGLKIDSRVIDFFNKDEKRELYC